MNFGTRKELLYVASPFAELFNRFDRSLRAAATLVVSGYSFRDDRVNRMIEESMVLRRGALRLVVVDPAVYTLADRFPLLWNFRADGVAKLIELRLDDARVRRDLLLAAREPGLPSPAARSWGSRLVVPLPTVPRPRHIEDVTRCWADLQQHFDSNLVRWGPLEVLLHSSPPENIAVALQAIIGCVVELVMGFDRLMGSMLFGPRFGSEFARVDTPRPSDVGPRPSVVEALRELGRAITVAHRTYSLAEEEFLEAVRDANCGKEAGAPDNFAMAELVIRDVGSRVEDMRWALRGVFEAIGYEDPFSGWPVPVASGDDVSRR